MAESWCHFCNMLHTAATIRRQAGQIRRLKRTLERRVKTIRRMQIVWEAAEIMVDPESTWDKREDALDTIREAMRHG